MQKTIVIYDGDTLSYRASAAIETRTVEVTHLSSGKTKILKNRTELKNSLKSKDKKYEPDKYSFKDIQESEPAVNAFSIMKNQIERINSDLFADEYLICLSGKKNFRDDLPLPSKYKGNRENLIRPTHLKACKEYLYKNHPSLLANNREADDDLIIKGYEYLNKGYTVILAGQDKDAFAYTGLTLYDFTQPNPELVLIPDFGYLEDTGKKITGKGFLWFCFQILNGDETDNFKPCELASIAFGKQSAFNILKDCKDKQSALHQVVNKYKEWYPVEFEYKTWNEEIVKADYKTMLDLYFKCARMMTQENDNLNAASFFNQYGVTI